MSEWQPIETAPYGSDFLVSGPDGMAVAYKDSYGNIEPCGIDVNYDMASIMFCIGNITHWMPLPEPPKQS